MRPFVRAMRNVQRQAFDEPLHFRRPAQLHRLEASSRDPGNATDDGEPD